MPRLNSVARELPAKAKWLVPAIGIALLITLGLVSATTARADFKPATMPAKRIKPLQWYTAYPQAIVEAQKQHRMILAYFCGSDWDEWTKKLDAEVFSTEMFKEWAEKNIVLLKLDFTKLRPPPALIQEQLDRLKNKYTIDRVPTLLFLDFDGLLVARAGYDTASLREDEVKGSPAAWIKYCDEVIKNPPTPELLAEIKDLPTAVMAVRKKFIPMVAVITKRPAPLELKKKTDLLKSQPFIRFVNHNMLFVQVEWPDDLDKSENANYFRTFASENKLGPAPFQILVWDFYGRNDIRVRDKLFAYNPQDMDTLIERLDKQVPTPDYSGAWLEDYKLASFTSSRMKRPLLICFTSMDSSEYCQKFFAEIFDTDEFKAYARKNLVLLKVDFPTKPPEQPVALKEQNKALADRFAVRGYPQVIIFNQLGQRIGDSKYMKGGPDPFMKQLESLIRSDRFSRP